MKKMITLFAALTLIAGAAMAGSGGGFDWTGTGAAYDATQKALILENANLTSLKIATWPTDKTNFGTTFTIIVKGDNNKINPTSKIDGITIGGSSYTEDDDIVVNINGAVADSKLEVSGQLNSAIYFVKNGDLRLRNLELVCNGRLQTAKYGISAATGCSFYLKPYAGVALTLDGKNGQFNNIFSFRPQGTSYAISYPEGATMNTESGNIFFILDGDNYYGKTTIMTGSGVKIGGVELDYTNWDNFTENVSAGKVYFAANTLVLERAQVNADMEVATSITIQAVGKSSVTGDVTLSKAVRFVSSDVRDTLTINGNVRVHGGDFTIQKINLVVYAPTDAFTLVMSGERGSMSVGGSQDGSLYMEYQNTGITQSCAGDVLCLSVPGYYTVDEYTKDGKKCFHARYVEQYGVTLSKNGEDILVTNENRYDPLGNGTVKFIISDEKDTLVLNNANLSSIDIDKIDPQRDTYVHLIGTNRIFRDGNNGVAVAIADYNAMWLYGEGSLDIITQNNLSAIALGWNAGLGFEDTKVNISASGYAFAAEEQSAIQIYHAEVSLQSGMPGLFENVDSFELVDAEIVSPDEVEFFNGQLCVNYQPLAANTKVVIKPTPRESIENVVLTEKAQKVLIDGQVYIIRDNKMFDLTGVQVR